MSRPTVTNVEKYFPENGEFIVSKTDTKGEITYANALLIEMSGYSEEELLGAPHNILRHPDMPKAIFKLLWDHIQRGDEVFAFVKNLSKDGSYYWVKAHVSPTFDNNGKIISYHSIRRKPKKEAISLITPIYQKMLDIEKQSGMEASTNYLFSILKDKGVGYDEFIFSL